MQARLRLHRRSQRNESLASGGKKNLALHFCSVGSLPFLFPWSFFVFLAKEHVWRSLSVFSYPLSYFSKWLGHSYHVLVDLSSVSGTLLGSQYFRTLCCSVWKLVLLQLCECQLDKLDMAMLSVCDASDLQCLAMSTFLPLFVRPLLVTILSSVSLQSDEHE